MSPRTAVSDGQANASKTMPNLWLLISMALIPFGAEAQNSEELRNLLFEPVLIERNPALPAPSNKESEPEEAALPGETVKEITDLPAGDNPIPVSVFLFNKSLQEQTTEVDNLESSISSYEETIRDIELDGDAYEPALIQELISIGSLYQQQGDHNSALKFFDQALHINRVNLGLFNLDQEQIIDMKIASHVALGDLYEADLQQEYLLYIKRKEYGSTSVEMLPALSEYADWNIFAFDSRLAMDPTQTYAAEASVYTEDQVNNAIGEEDLRTVRLLNAQNIYRTIINILLSNFGVSDRRLLDMEKKLALTNYFFATNLDVMSNVSSGKSPSQALNSSQGFYDMSRVSSNSMGYRHGREALERRIDYMLGMQDVSPLELAQARIDLADWLLLFKKRTAALNLYQEAYNALAATDTLKESINDLFSPVFPQTIPTFIDYRYSRASLGVPEDQPLKYHGWIDLRFEINRYGQTQNVEIVGQSDSTTDPVATRLLRHVRNSTSFRPRIGDGILLDQDLVETRYYYTY